MELLRRSGVAQAGQCVGSGRGWRWGSGMPFFMPSKSKIGHCHLQTRPRCSETGQYQPFAVAAGVCALLSGVLQLAANLTDQASVDAAPDDR